MKITVLSDIHSNHVALEKCIEYAALSKDAIQTGRDITYLVLSRAMELCKEETGEATWPYIPEKYWELAVAEQGISYI